MPEVVKPDNRKVGLLEERLEGPLPEVGRVHQRPLLGSKDEALVLVEVAETLPVHHLAGQVSLEGLHRRLCELHRPATSLRLGSPRTKRPLWRASVRLTRTTPSSRSTSSHLRPRSSPCLSPVVTASMYRASKRSSSLATSSRVLACSLLSGLISSGEGLGALTTSAMLRGIMCHLTAWSRALCKATCSLFTRAGATSAASLSW